MLTLNKFCFLSNEFMYGIFSFISFYIFDINSVTCRWNLNKIINPNQQQFINCILDTMIPSSMLGKCNVVSACTLLLLVRVTTHVVTTRWVV